MWRSMERTQVGGDTRVSTNAPESDRIESAQLANVRASSSILESYFTHAYCLWRSYNINREIHFTLLFEIKHH